MQGGRVLLAFLLLCGLAACQQQGQSPQTAKAVGSPSYIDANGMMPVNPTGMPHELPIAGDYRHAGSGLVLPETTNGFHRDDLAGFTDDDSDVSANYVLHSERVGISVYIFPVWAAQHRARNVSEIPQLCEEAFAGMKAAAEYRLKTPKLLQENAEPNPRFPDAVMSRMALYGADGDLLSDSPPVRSEIYMSCGVGKIWIVQYRITYPQDYDAETLRRDLMMSVPVIP